MENLLDAVVALIFFLLGIVGWFLKGAIDTASATKEDLSNFKLLVAREYTHKNDLATVISQINERFDRLEHKLDRIMEGRHAS
jgi:hypothetical protein